MAFAKLAPWGLSAVFLYFCIAVLSFVRDLAVNYAHLTLSPGSPRQHPRSPHYCRERLGANVHLSGLYSQGSNTPSRHMFLKLHNSAIIPGGTDVSTLPFLYEEMVYGPRSSHMRWRCLGTD